jgi:hypothetical protein
MVRNQLLEMVYFNCFRGRAEFLHVQGHFPDHYMARSFTEFLHDSDVLLHGLDSVGLRSVLNLLGPGIFSYGVRIGLFRYQSSFAIALCA